MPGCIFCQIYYKIIYDFITLEVIFDRESDFPQNKHDKKWEDRWTRIQKK